MDNRLLAIPLIMMGYMAIGIGYYVDLSNIHGAAVPVSWSILYVILIPLSLALLLLTIKRKEVDEEERAVLRMEHLKVQLYNELLHYKEWEYLSSSEKDMMIALSRDAQIHKVVDRRNDV